MTKTKLIVILSIIVIIVCGTDYATTFYFQHKSANLISQNTMVTPPNMIRDTSNKIPSIFADLVFQKDLKAIRESYVYIDVQKPLNQTPKAIPQITVQHTFKYVTNQSSVEAEKYFTDLFNKDKIKPIVVKIDPTTTSLRGYFKSQLYDIIINSKDASNVIVEITMVK